MQNPVNTSKIPPLNIDSIIERLLSVKGTRPTKNANITEQQIVGLIVNFQLVLQAQPMLLRLSTPVKICGDIHGQYSDLLRIFDLCGYPPMSNYLFMGDYVDRGKQGIEVMCLMMALKLKFPQNFFMLRGNHQSEDVTQRYGFFDQCKRRYSVQLWKHFCEMFNYLPVSALVDEKILCMHGGLSPELSNLQDINKIARPAIVPAKGLLCDLLWADPKSGVNGWAENQRGISYTFGQSFVHFLIQKFKLELICRAHQIVEDGYEFFAKRRLVTVFSAPNYMAQFDNSGAIMSVNQDLMCSFKILKPAEIQATAITAIGRPGSPPPCS